jgi:predicted ribosomally synthesized peptide with SipW-like signal peptide
MRRPHGLGGTFAKALRNFAIKTAEKGRNHMKTKLFLLVLAVLLVAGLAGGATMAWFTDQATNGPNNFTAGTVNIEADRDLGDPIPGPMFYTTSAEGVTPAGEPPLPANVTGPWYPGRTVTRILDVRNAGSLEVRLHQVSAEITSVNGVSVSDPSYPSALATSFANKMNVRIHMMDMVGGTLQNVNLFNGSLAELLTPQPTLHRPIFSPTGSIRPVFYEVTMLSSAGNDLQGIAPVVSFSVFAEQTKNNP